LNFNKGGCSKKKAKLLFNLLVFWVSVSALRLLVWPLRHARHWKSRTDWKVARQVAGEVDKKKVLRRLNDTVRIFVILPF
jgi:hypothetical protein